MQDIDSPIDLVKQFLTNFERRQRNLVKRKSKLDSYREKLAKGETLKDEQKKAVEGYESVLNSISLMQEMAAQSKELLTAIEKSSVLERSKMEQELEERTVSFLQISTCIQRFLYTLDDPSVRDAVVKSTSEGNLKLLDCVRNSITAPLMDDIPSASASEVPPYLQSREDLRSVSQNLYNLVVGRSVPVPTNSIGECPKKHSTFKDARNLCFRLMANPMVQRSMGIGGALDSAQTMDGDQIQNSPDELPESVVNHVSEMTDRLANQSSKVVHDTTQVLHGQQTSFPEVPTEQSVDHINPFTNTFNFLQASRIEVPVQLPEEPISYGENMMALNSENNDVVEFLGGTAEVELNSNSHSVDHASPRTINGEQMEDDTHPHMFTTKESAELTEHSTKMCSKPDSTEELEANSVSSKPISYADSVRKTSFTGPLPQRAVCETQPTNKRLEKPKENKEDRGDLPHPNMRNGYPRGGSYRGRSNNFDGRGGGAPRRGVGPRTPNHFGRGGAPRGMSQGIAQTTY